MEEWKVRAGCRAGPAGQGGLGRGTEEPETNFCYSGLARALLRGEVHVLPLRTAERSSSRAHTKQIQAMQPPHSSASPFVASGGQADGVGGKKAGN